MQSSHFLLINIFVKFDSVRVMSGLFGSVQSLLGRERKSFSAPTLVCKFELYNYTSKYTCEIEAQHSRSLRHERDLTLWSFELMSKKL